ncbi:MAG: Flp pilus assembly complex ATPase component TadA [Zetaproteobacteria bacterium]|nr:Flp pilus assembly complex ATPase component TadA [Zetaproteobacteria bacterium]
MRVSRLGNLLIQAGMMTAEQMEAAKKGGRRQSDVLPEVLVRLRLFSEADLCRMISEVSGLTVVVSILDQLLSSEESNMPTEFMAKNVCVPIERHGNRLVVAVADPFLEHLREEISFVSGFQQVDFVITTWSEIQQGLELLGGTITDLSEFMTDIQFEPTKYDEASEEDKSFDLSKQSDAALKPVVKVLNHIFLDAIERGVSDIHIEPYEKVLRVRYRLDGVLHDVMHLPYHMRMMLVSRIKVQSHLDISEQRLPQDGRITLRIADTKRIDLRVSVLPTLFGEKVVMRILDPANLQLDMSKLGYEARDLALIKNAIHEPYGMVLVTGPTGSGKTVSLYSAVSDLNQPERNISTVEDPVEFNFMGINQVAVRSEIGLTFPVVLRSLLRQDPDVILIGEIRDKETAHMAVEAALTGHMVLATLHTNDAPSTMTRLVEMGIEPFLVGSAVSLVVAQRLARLNCSSCVKPIEVSDAELLAAGVPEADLAGFTVMQGMGCRRCNDIGYKGRTGVYQVMHISEPVRQAVYQGKFAYEIEAIARANGMRTLREAALAKVKSGQLSLAECLRITAVH